LRIALILIALVAVSAPTGARAEGPAPVRLAALILKTGDVDQDLADNLTEVLIGRLAALKPVGAMELVGKEQLRARMGDERRALACIEEVACLGHIGVEMGITRIVVGTLGRRGRDYLYNLTLVDITTGKVENRIFELVAGEVEALIAAVTATAAKLFAPKIEPGSVRVKSATAGAMVYLDDAFVGSTPIRRDGIEPGGHRLRVEKEGHVGWMNQVDVPAGSMLEITVPLSALPERRRWPTGLVIATTGAGVVAEVVGVVLGVLSQQGEPPGATRAMALADTDRRRNLALLADGLMIGGGALLLTAVVTLIGYRKDIFGVREGSYTPAKAVASALAGGWRF
jgi:hypothetical protein